MICLTRLNRIPLVLNADLIEHIETTPDTVVILTTGQRFMVRETPDEVIERVVKFRRSLLAGLPMCTVNTATQSCEARAVKTEGHE
jgi:flagellar protein FlbD